MRRRRAQDAGRFSLFPFLAVLLCTMGSLIVLLLIVVQQSRVQAAEERAESPEPGAKNEDLRSEDVAALRSEAELLAAREQELADARAQLREQLKNSQLNLSHLEDHIRRLREQYAALDADYQVLQQSHEQDTQTKQQKLAELMRMRSQIDQAKIELEKAKKAADARPRSYAIIPYEGPGGTRRRPIYIECRAEQLIIQPEGVVLLPDDFAGASDAGNPLAAALRATREYLVETGGLQGGEPYPLLLVRPDGAQMYAAAMGAMQSWSSEYGYELIDADMQLELPPADEALGDVVRRTVNLARQRSVMMARARSMSGGGGGRNSYGGIGPGSGEGGSYLSASRDGGFQMHGSPRATDEWLERQVGASENPALGGSPPSGTGGGNASAGRSGTGSFYNAERPPTGPGGTAAGSAASTSGTGAAAGARGTGGGPSQGASSGDSAFAAAGASQNGPSSGQFGSAEGASPDGTSSVRSPNESGVPNRSPQQGATNHAGGMGSMSSQAPSTDPSPQSPPSTLQTYSPPPKAIAESRGENWALPRSAQGATTFHRPIRVECHADKLLVLPDRGISERPKTTQLSGPLESSIDNFVADLWQHMNAWGMAGPQSYWKPVLSVEVAPDGEARFRELSALMQRSGVEVQRK